MAPRPLDLPEDQEVWLDEVEAYYEKRGVPFERHPKVAGRPVSLFKLYKLVMEHGGYDTLSAERMKWRTLVKHFGFGSQHEAAMTFQLKTAYFKNLAAYEIASYWKEQPPPPEILENVTAKGGALRMRTLENFAVPVSRESGALVDGAESGEEEPRSPKPENMEVDEPGSASRYPTRQLRQDPKKTQMYQPDSIGSRQRFGRTTSSPQASPAPQTYNSASADPRNSSFNIEKYEPKQPITLSLRPVVTPGNNYTAFYQQKQLEKGRAQPKLPFEPQNFLRPIIPNNLVGPNIYQRCLWGLRSGIPDEQDFALHHLVKVSYERGDKYKFEGFTLLAESLLEKALEITQLVYNFTWEVSYDLPENTQAMNTLNGAFGTPNLLQRLKALKVETSATEPETAEFMQKLDKLNEAALIIRNMVILEENSAFISKFPLFRDFLLIGCNLPQLPSLTEYRQYCLEMAEQATRYWEMSTDDPLYLSLLQYLESDDRGSILCAARAIYRIGMDTQNTHQLAGVKTSTVERMTAFTLLESDDDLVEAALEFLYKFTASSENINSTMSSNPEIFIRAIPRLVTLLLHNAIPKEETILISVSAVPPKNTIIPAIPSELHQQLMLVQEPERSSRWLRCCFEESREDDITQIAIWQAYQGRFTNAIPAADFIKNVSNTFATAQAQVINGPVARFIIKGIRPRRTLVDLSGAPMIKCMWEISNPEQYDVAAQAAGRHLCQQWQSTREKLWSHILIDHLGIQRNEAGRFPHDSPGPYTCKWSSCLRSSPIPNSWEAGCHVKMHIPQSAEDAAKWAEEAGKKDAESISHTSYYTQTDERGHPCGIPYMSVLVLRNLARFAIRRGEEFNSRIGDASITLMDRFFGHVKADMWHTLSVSRTLSWLLTDCMKMIEKGERLGEERKVEPEHRDESLDVAMA